MDKNLESAIIGYYLSGASIEEIIGITGLFYLQVARLIEEYRRKTSLN